MFVPGINFYVFRGREKIAGRCLAINGMSWQVGGGGGGTCKVKGNFTN